MPSLLDTLEVSPTQGTTAGKPLDLDALLSLRMMFLLLDAWDRNGKPAKPATLVDMQLESGQGEPHAQAVSARQQRTT